MHNSVLIGKNYHIWHEMFKIDIDKSKYIGSPRDLGKSRVSAARCNFNTKVFES